MASFGDQFLSSMAGGGGDLVSTAFNTLVGAATGGFKGRPQWKDLQFMNDAQNRLWPDEIKRQGAFLQGLAPSQAAAYNTYQGATYQGDTDRQVDRIKDMSAGLGMSPWEITGAGGANPLPSPGPPQGQQGRSAMPEYLSALVPMQIAKQQNKTALMTTKMQTDTQRYIADQATGQGKLPLKQIEGIASQIDLNQITGSNGLKDLDTKQQNMVVQIFQTLLQAMPKDTLQLPGLSSTSTPGWRQLAKKMFSDSQVFKGDSGRLDQALSSLSPDDWGTLKRIIIETATSAAKGGQDMMKGVGDFLGSLTGKQ